MKTRNQAFPRFLCFLLLFCLLTGGIALTEGEKKDSYHFFTDEEYNPPICSLAGVGDDLYLLENKGLYLWNPAIKTPTLVSSTVSPLATTIHNTEKSSNPMENFDGSVQIIAGSKEGLWGLNTYEGLWCRIEEKEGAWNVHPLLALDWANMVEEGPYQAPKGITTIALTGNTLALLVAEDRGFGQQNLVLFDVTTGEQRPSSLKNIQAIAPFNTHQVLASQFDGGFHDQDEQTLSPQLGTIDLLNDSFTPWLPYPLAKWGPWPMTRKVKPPTWLGRGNCIPGARRKALQGFIFYPYTM